jgi:hypothetical protein
MCRVTVASIRDVRTLDAVPSTAAPITTAIVLRPTIDAT